MGGKRSRAEVMKGFQTVVKDLSNGRIPASGGEVPEMPPIEIRSSLRSSIRSSSAGVVKNEMHTLGHHLGRHFCDISTPLREGLMTRKGREMHQNGGIITPYGRETAEKCGVKWVIMTG